jgi:diketogulonate reductase-like aldo/keto reductase
MPDANRSDHGAAPVRLPKIIYGTAWKQADTERLVKIAIERGFRGIDTACQPRHYDEAGVGRGVAACLDQQLTRADLYLQTKFTAVSGQDPASIPYDPSAPLPTQVAQSFAVSLRNLKTSYLDCLVLHSPFANARHTLTVWRAMESLVAGGGVRRLGISNCYELDTLAALYDAAHIKPTVLQNRFYADTGYDREIRAFCGRQRIIYQSFWTLTANPRLLGHDDMAALASKYARTAAQILFRYLTQNDVVPLTGTTSVAHMREDLAIFEFQLTDADLEVVSSVLGAPS